MKIITRDEAREAGLKRFYAGVPCKNGHLAERYVLDWKCAVCHREKATRHRAANLDAVRERDRKSSRKYREENREARRERDRLYRAANLDAVRERARKAKSKSRAEQPELHRAYARKLYAESPQVRAEAKANAAARRATKLDLTPDNANHAAIARIYADAKYFSEAYGVDLHVDHWIPLNRGGLHHEDNLVLLSAKVNMEKGAKLPGVDWFPPPNVFEQVTVITRIR